MQAVQRPKDSKYIFTSPWKRWGARLFDVLGRALFAAGPSKAWDPAAVRRILVIRMDQLGDAVFALPAVEYLHQIFGRAEIDFLAGPWAAPLVEHFLPSISQTLVFENNWYSPQRRIFRCIRNARQLIRDLRTRRYDLGIDLRGDLRNIALMKTAGVARTVGYGITGGGFLLDRVVEYDFSAHQVDLNLRLVAQAGKAFEARECPAPTPEERRPRLFFPDAVMDRVSNSEWTGLDRPRVLAHTQAGYPSKCWAKERFRHLVIDLCARGISVALVGTAQDDLCDVPELKKHAGRILDLRGKTNLLQLCGLIRHADLLIGNDSAPSHLAAALGTPCIVLFSGANDPARWMPIGDGVHVVFHAVACSPCERRTCPMPTHACMEAISVREVEKLVADVLGAKASQKINGLSP